MTLRVFFFLFFEEERFFVDRHFLVLAIDK